MQDNDWLPSTEQFFEAANAKAEGRPVPLLSLMPEDVSRIDDALRELGVAAEDSRHQACKQMMPLLRRVGVSRELVNQDRVSLDVVLRKYIQAHPSTADPLSPALINQTLDRVTRREQLYGQENLKLRIAYVQHRGLKAFEKLPVTPGYGSQKQF